MTHIKPLGKKISWSGQVDFHLISSSTTNAVTVNLIISWVFYLWEQTWHWLLETRVSHWFTGLFGPRLTPSMIHQSHTLDSAAFKPKRVHLEHRERDLLRPQIVQTNDSVHSHRNQGYQKRYFQPQGMSHELTFLTKKNIYIYIFSKRQTTSTTQGWCFERSSSTENGFYSDASPGSICLVRKWRKGRCPGSSCLKSAFKFAKEFPIYMLSQLMLIIALKQELHSTQGGETEITQSKGCGSGAFSYGTEPGSRPLLLITLIPFSLQVLAQSVSLHDMGIQKASRFLFDHTRFVLSCNLLEGTCHCPLSS